VKLGWKYCWKYCWKCCWKCCWKYCWMYGETIDRVADGVHCHLGMSCRHGVDHRDLYYCLLGCSNLILRFLSFVSLTPTSLGRTIVGLLGPFAHLDHGAGNGWRPRPITFSINWSNLGANLDQQNGSTTSSRAHW